jgi:hypothetical protein
MVLASNVDLDLNGYVLEDTTADNQSIGILVDHQQNVTIRNGKIRGFKQLIVLDDHSKRVTWPGNDLTFAKVAVQSVEASKDAPVDGGKEPQPKATTEWAKTTPESYSLRRNFPRLSRQIRRNQEFAPSYSQFEASSARREMTTNANVRCIAQG